MYPVGLEPPIGRLLLYLTELECNLFTKVMTQV